MKNDEDRRWYRKFLDNRNVGISTSAIVRGGIGAGLRYLLHKNKFLSSFRAAEKIKDASYFKFVSAGAMTAVGLYELLKRLTKPKQSDKSNLFSKSMNNSESKEEKPKIDYSKTIKVAYICPSNLYSLFELKDGLKTDTANRIEDILVDKGEIKKYNKNQFWFCANQECYSSLVSSYLKDSKYAAALYLINEDQKESFKNMFKEKSLLYNLYTIEKPTSKDNLRCYALPLESSVDKEDNKTYSFNISSKITEANIDSYSFKLTEADANHINLNKKDIVGVDFISRINWQKASNLSD